MATKLSRENHHTLERERAPPRADEFPSQGDLEWLDKLRVLGSNSNGGAKGGKSMKAAHPWSGVKG